MSEPTIFDKIVSGELPSYKVWEDDKHLAFLSRYGNTPGFTVVVPKTNPGDNYLDVADDVYVDLLLAAKKVAALLREAYGIYRVGLVLEGEGVPHLHVKLIPMHGLEKKAERQPHDPQFTMLYQGYLTTIEGPEINDDEAKAIQAKILKAAQ